MSQLLLDREEYIEQAYFFRVFRERLEESWPAQEILAAAREEVLATTRLPLAIDFLRGEILHNGKTGEGMERLLHYFTPFQAFVMQNAEADKARLDAKVALLVLERLAEYLAGSPTPAGLFVYQFECIARNRLGYDRGLKAMSEDVFYDADWRAWIARVRFQVGTTDFTDLIYYRSEHFVQERRRRTGNPDYRPAYPVFFSLQEGRIARANTGKDPLYMFAALQRQLGYPQVPRPRAESRPILHPALEARLKLIEKRIKLVESEMKGGMDLSEFYAHPPTFNDLDDGGSPPKESP